MELDMDRLPEGGLELIRRLNAAGYEAWFVGGCVRDLLLGFAPKDWDICTNARPEETEKALADFRVHETGIRHGTVLVMAAGEGYEVTTYRTETAYTDHRHPDEVRFVRRLEDDLARRDFTINAMALHPEHGLVDCFGGRADLERGLIRAVGDPARRFGEDALRVLRAVRFAARYGFAVEERTAQAVHERKKDLELIARERIFSELKQLICCPHVRPVLTDYSDVIGVFLPEILPAVGYDQHHPHHRWTLWEHILRVVEGVPPDDVCLRLAALFHDLGKPDCRTVDESGVAHYYGHGKRSAEKADQALRRLKCDNATRFRVVKLVELHDRPLPQDRTGLRRRLQKVDPEIARQLVLLRRADVLAQSELMREEKLREVERYSELLEEELRNRPCLTLRELAIGGADVIALGIDPGPEVGRALKDALNAVVEGKVENEKAALLDWLQKNAK